MVLPFLIPQDRRAVLLRQECAPVYEKPVNSSKLEVRSRVRSAHTACPEAQGAVYVACCTALHCNARPSVEQGGASGESINSLYLAIVGCQIRQDGAVATCHPDDI